MRVKSYKLIHFSLFISMIVALGLLKIIPFLSGMTFNRGITMAFISVAWFVSLFVIRSKSRKIISLTVLYVYFLVVVAIFKSEASSIEIWRRIFDYLYILAAIPIYKLLVTGKWQLDELLEKIVIFTFISYGLRTFISIFESVSGTIVFPEIALECATENWRRGSLLRINPPCFACVVIPILYYLLVKSRVKKEKYIYWCLIISSVAYSIFIHGARSYAAYQIVELIFLYLFRKRESLKKIVSFVLISIIAIVAINTDYFQAFLSGLDPNTSGVYGYSSRARLGALAYYSAMLINNPFGVGFLKTENLSVYSYSSFGRATGSLGDLGIMNSLVVLGISFACIYMIYLYISVVAARKQRKHNNNLDILCAGFAICLVFISINMDLFYTVNAYAAPYILAISTYIYRMENREII